VQRRLTAIVHAVAAAARTTLTALGHPLLAGIIWWKQGCVAVVEVSIVVDRDDVDRARAGAGTLVAVGTHAVPMVIGESWAQA